MEKVEEAKETKYSVIYADVPWEDRDWSLEKIREVPVENRAASDALLLLWVHNPLLPEALLVVRAWGFAYAGLLCWRKPADEVGEYFPHGQCEYMLVARRGTAKTSHILRDMLYEGTALARGYKPKGFRSILWRKGKIAFGEAATYLDVFGQYWQEHFEDYDVREWDCLELGD